MAHAKLLPVYFESPDNKEFVEKLANLEKLLEQEAKFLDPISIQEIDEKHTADAVVFPRIIGDIYKKYSYLQNIELPILILTSQFGTMAMWDWEIVSYLKEKGIEVYAPYELDTAHILCRALSLKREMKDTSFVVYQDDPGDGMQSSIFKRFFWWENECKQNIEDTFGIDIIKKSYKSLGEKAKNIRDKEAKKIISEREIKTENLPEKNLLSAVKLYLQLKKEIEENGNVGAVGTNCLNESYFSDTTPCLAWDLLYKDREMVWGCEADLLIMITKYIVYKVLQSPIIMSNIYPFLMGEAALRHERINSFPDIKEPENCILVAHCGYLGVVPEPFAEQWTLKPGVLEIVEDNSVAIDARLPEGDVTFSKLNSSLNKLFALEGSLEGYVQYPDSDCKNGAVIRVEDGRELMEKVFSHHNCILTGQKKHELKILSRIFNLKLIP